jgi:hypothetical protein
LGNLVVGVWFEGGGGLRSGEARRGGDAWRSEKAMLAEELFVSVQGGGVKVEIQGSGTIEPMSSSKKDEGKTYLSFSYNA